MGDGLNTLREKKLSVLALGLAGVYVVAQLLFWQSFVRERLARTKRQALVSEDIVLADQIKAIDWIIADSNGSKFKIDFREKYFYPGFRNRNAYTYLLRWRRTNLDSNAQTIYFIVQPRNWKKARQDVGKILGERDFGGENNPDLVLDSFKKQNIAFIVVERYRYREPKTQKMVIQYLGALGLPVFYQDKSARIYEIN